MITEEQMNDKEKAAKYDELIEKSNGGEEVLDIEGQKWLLMHPDMQQWIESHMEMIEWMTESTKYPPRSDCG
jgi:hypothetical protein